MEITVKKENEMRKSLLFYATLILLCVIIIPAVAQAQIKKGEGKTPVMVRIADEPAVVISGMTFTIGDAIRKAVESNHDIIAGSYDVAMTDSLYEKYKKKYTLFLNASGGMKYQKNPGAMEFLYGKDSRTLDGDLSIARMFSSGTTVAAGMKHQFVKTTYPTMSIPVLDGSLNPTGDQLLMSGFGSPEYHMPLFFVSVQQELLKNSFGYGERRMKKLLENTAKMQKDAILFQLSMVVTGVIVDYWTVVMKKFELENAGLQLAETRKVRNITAKNVRLGLADSFNLNYYNALVAGAEARVSASKQAYNDALRTFLSTVNLDENMKIDDVAVLTDKLPDINMEAAMKAAYAKRADYRNAELNLKNARLELEMYSNEALPSVTAELNVSSLSQRDTVSDAWTDTGAIKYPSYEARLRVSYPLDDREQKINERNARFRLKQARIQLDKSKREVRDEISSRVEQITTSHDLYLKAREARIQSELFYRKMLVSMRRGRLTAATVKNGLDAMVSGREQELQALVYYNVALLQLDVAKNELWENYNIDVEKYIPTDRK